MKIENKDLSKDIILALDSSGIKVTNRGDWLRKKWKVRRGWIKVHIGVDTKSKKLMALEITEESVGDNRKFKELLKQAEDNAGNSRIISSLADGGYDTKKIFNILEEKGIKYCQLILLLKNRIISAFNVSGQNADIALKLLPYIAFLSVYVMMTQVFNSAISGLGRMDISKYIISGSKIITAGTSLTLLWLGNGIKSLLIGNILSYIFIGVTSIFIIRKIANISIF